MNELTQLVADLVAIDSVNPDLVPGGAGEGAIARFIAAWCERAGLEVHLVEPQAGRPSVVAIARGSGGGRDLLLNGHIDTVGVAGMARPFTPRIADGRLYGRGSYDMKGAVAACLWAAARARGMGLRGNLIVSAVADEEVASLGTQAVLERFRADAAIVTEPTGLELCVAHKGFVWLEVITEGRAAHGSKPELGIDAIVKMWPVLAGIEALGTALQSGAGHQLLGSGSIHASLINGGQELSSYPASCRLDIERRTIPGEHAEQVEAQVRAILEQAASNDAQFRAQLRTTLVREPFEAPAGAPIVELLARQVEQVRGVAPRRYGDTPWMDAAFTAAAGIPTVVFGPAGAGAHAIEEWVDLASVEQCAAILSAVAQQFCA